MSRPSLKKGLGIMKFSEKIELAINNAGWAIEENTLIHSDCPDCGIVLPENTDDVNVAQNLRRWLDGTICEAMCLVDILGEITEADGYYFAVHCNEHANPKEDVEVVIFGREKDRDDFINSTSWPYEAVNEPTEIYAGPFWDWAEVKADLAELGYPSHVIWRFEPKKTEPDMMVITTAV